MFNLDDVLPKTLQIVRDAGKIIAQNWTRPHEITHKGAIDLVTETDRQVEDYLHKHLGQLLPEAAFIGEESAKDLNIPADKPLCWIVDPVDGTTNFVHRQPPVSVSVALCEEGVPVVGVVDAPMLQECFYAARDSRAFCNGEPVEVSAVTNLSDAVVATGFPYDVSASLDDILRRLARVLPATQGLRRLGSAAIDLCWVACGRLDAFYEAGLKPWDMAAGWLIVLEGGGQLSDFAGRRFDWGRSVLASNGKIHADMVNLLI